MTQALKQKEHENAEALKQKEHAEALKQKEHAEAAAVKLRVSLASIDEQINKGDTTDFDKLLTDIVIKTPDGAAQESELKKALKIKQGWADRRAMLEARRSALEAALQDCALDMISAETTINRTNHERTLKEMGECAKLALLEWHNLNGLIEQYATLKQQALLTLTNDPDGSLYSPRCEALQEVAGEMITTSRVLANAAVGTVVANYRGMTDVLRS